MINEKGDSPLTPPYLGRGTEREGAILANRHENDLDDQNQWNALLEFLVVGFVAPDLHA